MIGRATVLERILPRELNDYRGSRWVVMAMAVYAALLTVRSLIHMFSSDGGANSTAAMGALKPIATDGTAPGAALNEIALIPLGVLLVLSITTVRTPTPNTTRAG